MNPSKRLLPALLALAVYCASAAAASAITITSNDVHADMQSPAGGGDLNFTGTSVPTSQLLDITRGAFYSRTQIDYLGSGNNVTLLHTFDQKRSGALYDYSETYDNGTVFTVSANTTYNLSGAFSVTDVSTAGRLYFSYYLQDLTTSGFLAYNFQVSDNTLNESFVLGGSGGDSGNSFTGSLTGVLLAGHQYRFIYDAFTQAYPDTDGGATAKGYLRLDIGGGAPSSVPDSGTTLTLLGLAVLSLADLRRRVSRR